MPSFSDSSLLMRSSPQEGFSVAISRIKSRSPAGRRGLPVGFDFHRQNKRNPFRCQRTSVSGLTMTSDSRQSNSRLSTAMTQRPESSARRGLTLRSWKKANCFRRKRFSAARAERECAARMTSRPRSVRTAMAVRRQCLSGDKKNNGNSFEAQDRTFERHERALTVGMYFLRTTRVWKLMATASLHLASSRPDHARATTLRGACTTAERLDAETFRGFPLAGDLFLLTSFLIEQISLAVFRSALSGQPIRLRCIAGGTGFSRQLS